LIVVAQEGVPAAQPGSCHEPVCGKEGGSKQCIASQSET
jgi:hypothetical protein